MILPGFAQLKLWPEALVALGEDPEQLPLCNPRFEKRVRPLVHRFSSAPLPLKKIYVLGQDSNPEIMPLRSQEALAELVHHTYGALGVGRTPHFFACANVVNSVEVYSLSRRRSLTQLPHLVRLVEEDLTRST